MMDMVIHSIDNNPYACYYTDIMALIKLDRTWNNRRVVTVDGHKAYEIKQLLIDLPEDLSEDKLDFLKAIECIYFADGTKFPESPRIGSHLTHEGIEQGMNQAIPKGDR